MKLVNLSLWSSKKSKIRNNIRGFQKLRNENRLEVVSNIKEELSRMTLDIKSENASWLIFGNGKFNHDIVVRQFLVAKILTIDFNKNILHATLDKNREISHPLPKKWRKVLENNGFKADTWKNKLNWNFFLLTQFTIGLASILFYFLKSLRQCLSFKKSRTNSYSYFQTLSNNNLPLKHEDDSQSHDIISWYRNWNKKSNKVNLFAHSVRQIQDDRDKSNLLYMPSAIPNLYSIPQIIKYLWWGFLTTLFSFFDILRGRYWHALLLRESSKCHIVRLLEPSALAADYLFHNSNHIYRPLWTYESELKGARILFYFYSTNCETFKKSKEYQLQENTWHLMSWSNYLVWDQYQADFIIRSVGKHGHKIEIVGPIWFSTSLKKVTQIFSERSIAVFDVQPMRESYYSVLGQTNDYYNPNIANQFLSDIYEILNQNKFIVLFKRKRNIGKLAHSKYLFFLKKLCSKQSFISLDPDLDIYKIIEKSAGVISMPFTSTAIIARELGKPSAYYDPFGQIEKDDRAAHGISILSGKIELNNWVKSKLS